MQHFYTYVCPAGHRVLSLKPLTHCPVNINLPLRILCIAYRGHLRAESSQEILNALEGEIKAIQGDLAKFGGRPNCNQMLKRLGRAHFRLFPVIERKADRLRHTTRIRNEKPL